MKLLVAPLLWSPELLVNFLPPSKSYQRAEAWEGTEEQKL